MSVDSLDRYSRQTRFAGIGEDGQRRLLASHVTLCGCGALGTVIAYIVGGMLLDGHGLVRARRSGPLALDGDFDRTLLPHVSILKLAEEEAQAIVGDGELEELRALGVPEVVVTFGGRGSLVITRDAAVRVVARPARGDPTGAGDAFSIAYLSARAGGHRPISAARRASSVPGPSAVPSWTR